MKTASLSAIGEILKKANNIALAAHVNPDGDALGSVLGLGMLLEKLGKTAYMFIDDDIPQQFMFMPNVRNIKKPSLDTILQTDLLVILDASDCERVGRVCQHIKTPLIVNLDHHISNNGFADILFLDVQAAATSEIIFNLVKEMGIDIDRDMAVVLYTGIVTDCGFFRYANTTPLTLRIAAELLETGIQPNEISDFIETQTIETLRILPKVLNTLEFYLDGRLASISISTDLYKDDMDGDVFVKYPRYIEGVEVALLFKGVSERETRVSMRSRDLDVSRVAMEFGGGGHVKAAGCTVSGAIPVAKDKIIASLTKHLGVAD